MTLSPKAAFDTLTAADWNEMILSQNPPGCIAKRVAVQSLTSAAPNTFSFDNEEFDNAGFFAPTSTNVTVPYTAVWDVFGWMEVAANTSGMRSLEIALNGSTLLVSEAQPPPSSFSARLSVAAPYYAAAGSVFTLIGFQNAGVALNATARLGIMRHTGA